MIEYMSFQYKTTSNQKKSIFWKIRCSTFQICTGIFLISWFRIRILNIDPDSGGCWIQFRIWSTDPFKYTCTVYVAGAHQLTELWAALLLKSSAAHLPQLWWHSCTTSSVLMLLFNKFNRDSSTRSKFNNSKELLQQQQQLMQQLPAATSAAGASSAWQAADTYPARPAADTSPCLI